MITAQIHTRRTKNNTFPTVAGCGDYITVHIIVTACIASNGSCAAAAFITITLFNPLMGTSNYSATSNDMKLVHWPLMGGLLHLVQREGPGRGRSPARPLLAVPNVTVHSSTVSVPISVLL